MFILEGPDGSGKSVLGAKLGRSLNVRVLHEGGPPRSKEELVERLRWQFDNFGQILDRSPIVSERVYGPILRGHTMIPARVLDNWTERFIRRGWTLVYCRPSNAALLAYARDGLRRIAQDKSYKTTQHAESVVDNMPAIIRAYDVTVEKMRRKGMTVMTYVRD